MNKNLSSHLPNESAVDLKFQNDVTNYIDTLIEQEKKDFQEGGLESFEIHANKIRHRIRQALNQFQKSYENGYNAINQLLQTQGSLEEMVPEENLQIFTDPAVFMDALGQGKQIYQLLGFSAEKMALFLKTASHLMETREFEKARDAFYFLTTIAPEMAGFWLGLSICYTQLKEYEEAIAACSQAIDLNPNKVEPYLHGLHLFVQVRDFERALTLCQKGIDFALDHPEEPWAQVLGAKLEVAKQYITTLPDGGR